MRKLIVFEGPDGAGKATQAQLLVDKLRAFGYFVTLFSFPRYDTETGKLVARYLRGEFGDFSKFDPYAAARVFAQDHVGAQQDLVAALEQGLVICDRSWLSNFAYQGAKLSGEQRAQFWAWLSQQYQPYNLPQIDRVLWLDLPIELASERIADKRGRVYLPDGQADSHEANLDFLVKVREAYQAMAQGDPDRWFEIACADRGLPKTRQEIHRQVLGCVLSALGTGGS